MNSDWRSMSSGPTGSPTPHSQPLSRFTAGQTNVANYSDLRWSKRRSSDAGAADDAPGTSKDDREEARSPWRTTIGNSAESQETADHLLGSSRPRLSASASPRALNLALPSRSDNSSSSPSRSPVLRQSPSLRSSPRSGFLRLHPVSANYGRIEDGAYSRPDMDLGSAVYSSVQKSSPQFIPPRSRKTSFTSLSSTSGSPAQRDLSWRPRSNNSGNSLAPSPSLGSSPLAANSLYKQDNEVLKRRSTVGGISVDESARKTKEARKQSFTGEREQYGLGLERMFPLSESRRTESQRWQTGGGSSQLAQLETVRSTSMSPSKSQSSASGSLSNRPTQKLVSGSYKSPPLALLSLNGTSSMSGYDNEGSSPAPPKYNHFQPSSSLLEITQALRSKVDVKGSANGGATRHSTAKLSPPQKSVPRSVQLNSRRQSTTPLQRPPRSPSAMYTKSRPEPNNARGSLTHNRSYANLRQTARRSTDTSIMGGALGLSVGQDGLQDEVGVEQYDEVVASENHIHRREHGDLPAIQHQQASYLPRRRTLSTRSTNDVLPETRRSADQKLVPMQSRNGRPTERTRPLSLRLSRSETSAGLQHEPPIDPPSSSSKPLSVLFFPFAEAPRVHSGLDTVTTEADSFSLPSSKRTASPTLTTSDESPRSRSSLGLPPDVVESCRSLPSSSFDFARTNGENGEVLVLREWEEIQTRTETEAAGKQSEEADNRHEQKQLEGDWFASGVDARAMMVGSRKHSYEEMLKQLLAGLRSIDLSEDLYDETTHRSACGGYSDIYQARSRRHNGMLVAVKRLRFKITEENAWKPVYRELNVWSGLNHPNIHALLGYAMHGEYPALISKWLSKGSARDYFQGNPEIPTRHMTKGIAAGLTFLHNQDIVHSDLKAENIFVSDEGEPLLADFGISRILSSATITTSSNVKGSPRWMAIELLALPSDDFDSKYSHTKETDVWAFGMVIYELLTKSVPFDYLKHNIHVVLAITSNRLPSQPTPLDDKDGQLLWSICEHCWNRNPRDRPDMTWICARLT